MKLFTFALAAVALAEEKKVPPRTPLDRIEQLRRHINRLMDDHFSGCAKASAWGEKLNKICDRAIHAWERTRECKFFDPDVPHGGPEEEEEELRYSTTNAKDSINGITAGLRNWSKRYLADCGGQKNHGHLVNKANKWRAKLNAKLDADTGLATC